jgi:hypothetical protein
MSLTFIVEPPANPSIALGENELPLLGGSTSADRPPLIEVGPDPRPAHIDFFHLLQLESSLPKDGVYLAVEMASAAIQPVKWRETILPTRHIRIAGTAMLHEVETALRLQHPPNLPKRAARLGDGAQSPGADGGIHGILGEGDSLPFQVQVLNGK